MWRTLGNGNRGGTDPALRRLTVPPEKQEEDRGCRSPEERLLTPPETRGGFPEED